ncbi:hypothetical protein KKB55_20495 [Myxococcota bacterium]|nr:hypothetical protein [Myxococcota bacterium]MBU1900129.1 hypothetical protein [Myxococcota bacterium]
MHKFTRFLLSQELIDEALAQKLERCQLEGKPPLGQILVRSKRLSVDQLMKCLYFQADHPNIPLGRIAIDLGFISEAVLVSALLEQSSYRACHPAHRLLISGEMSKKRLLEVLILYLSKHDL